MKSSRHGAVISVLLYAVMLSPLQAFELQRMDGVRTHLDQYVGGDKWTLVMLWTTDCVPCEQQKPMIGEFHDDHADRDARVVGMALDGPQAIEEITAIVARHASSYPTLVAFDDVIAEQFQALTGKPFRATPTYLLYKPDGTLAGSHTGLIAREQLEGIVAGSVR